MKAPQLTTFLLLAIAGLTSAAPTGFGTAGYPRNFVCLFTLCENTQVPPPPPATLAPTPTGIPTVGNPQESLIVPLGLGPVISPQS